METIPTLEDLCALAQVAVTVPPRKYPAWSDGYEANMAPMHELWWELRPSLARDERTVALDKELLEMMAASQAGDSVRMRMIAFRVYSAACGVIDWTAPRARWPFLKLSLRARRKSANRARDTEPAVRRAA